MEAVVIDVTTDFCGPAEDDLRTDADFEEISIAEEFSQRPMEDFDDSVFSERQREASIVSTVTHSDGKVTLAPKKPPRKRSDNSESLSHKTSDSFSDAVTQLSDDMESYKSAIGSLASKSDRKRSKSDEDSSEHDNKSKRIKDNAGVEDELLTKKAFEVSATKPSTEPMDVDVQELPSILKKSKVTDLDSDSPMKGKKDDSQEGRRNSKEKVSSRKSSSDSNKGRKSSDASSADEERQRKKVKKTISFEDQKVAEPREKSVDKQPLKRAKSYDTENDDDSLQEFEKRKSLRKSDSSDISSDTSFQKDPQKSDSKPEVSLKKRLSKDGSGDSASTDRETGSKSKRKKRRGSQRLSKSSSKEDDSLEEYEKQKERSKSSERKELLSSEKEVFVQAVEALSQGDEGQTVEKNNEPPPPCDTEYISSSDAFSPEAHKKSLESLGHETTSDVESIISQERSVYEDTHDQTDTTFDQNPSVLESLTQSLQEIQRGLAAVESQVRAESSDEPYSAQESLTILESLVQPITEIQRGLELVEQKINEDCATGEYSAGKTGIAILETLAQPIREFERSLTFVEQQQFQQHSMTDGSEESLLERTNQSILESVAQPLQELHREIALIQKQAVMETDTESFSGKF